MSRWILRRALSTIPMELRLIPKEEVRRYMIDSMLKSGASERPSRLLADVLVEADYRGHFSHGLNRLEMYVDDILLGLIHPHGKPRILKESSSTAWVDGENGLGVVVGDFSMKLAIEKAKESGIGFVSAKGSNHFGICQWYAEQAVSQGLIGLAFTNTSPFLTPTRSKDRAFGTNPICICAPGLNGDSFTLDMATTGVAVGKIEMQMRKDEKLPSTSWALGQDGRPTLDAEEAFHRGRGLMPLGGSEINSGYKGYGLAMMVEVFCGLLGEAAYGPNIRQWMNRETPGIANLGQCFIAINPESFGEGFSDRLQDLMDVLRNSSPVEDSKPVLVPGDPERAHRQKVDEAGGILYTENHIVSYRKMAERLGISPMVAKQA